MLKIVILSALLATTHARNFRRVPRYDGRIVGGTPADITDAPYQVALLIDWWEIGEISHRCGGSLIADNVVVSASHCCEDSEAYEWEIRAGSTYRESGGQVRPVSKIVMHPRYDTISLDYDISLFITSSPFEIDNVRTALVPLPPQDAPVETGSPAFVTGWGATTEGSGKTDDLRKVTIPIVDQRTCNRAYANLGGVTDRMLCAGLIETGGQDACNGDSGGPLTINGVLNGITSWGEGCARPGYPGVWTRVTALRDWIDAEMAK